jgi:hypothetical protein
LKWTAAALVSAVVILLLGACTSTMYVHTLWEAGNNRCGELMGSYGGWQIGFNGRTDDFVCTVRDAKLRVVAQTEIPVENVMGRSGGWPFFPQLVAHELEDIDGELP